MIGAAGLFFILLVIALVATIGVESLVALAFRGRRKEVVAVVGTNLITNPLFNLAVLLAAYVIGIGDSSWAPIGWLLGPLTIALELVVVVVEWRILVFVTAGTWGTSRRLLLFSIVANLASALSPVGLLVVINWALVAFQP